MDGASSTYGIEESDGVGEFAVDLFGLKQRLLAGSCKHDSDL